MWYTLRTGVETKDESAMPMPESCLLEIRCVAASNEDVIILVLTTADHAEVVR